jgi:ABC-type transporter Mla maintaining outer membrane lipid asymmetry permease subunit MlaE
MIGTIILAVGLAVMLSFGYYTFATIVDFRKAQMVHERNPGNAMYDLQYFVAASQLVFLLGGAVGGALLALNGATWLALGGAARASGRGGSA